MQFLTSIRDWFAGLWRKLTGKPDPAATQTSDGTVIDEPTPKPPKTEPATPKAPTEPQTGTVPSCIIDTKKFGDLLAVKFRELMGKPGERGRLLEQIWWCAQAPLIAGMVKPDDQLGAWSIAGNIGCTVAGDMGMTESGLILYGRGFPGEGFESGGFASPLLPVSKFPPKRYELRKDAPLNRKSDPPQVRRVLGRSTHGHPALPANKCYYNKDSTGEIIYRCRIHGSTHRTIGGNNIWTPVDVGDHGVWLEDWIERTQFDPRISVPGTGDGGGEFSP